MIELLMTIFSGISAIASNTKDSTEDDVSFALDITQTVKLVPLLQSRSMITNTRTARSRQRVDVATVPTEVKYLVGDWDTYRHTMPTELCATCENGEQEDLRPTDL